MKIVITNLNILFHVYRCHKNNIPALRAWFVARHILDENGSGYVDIEKLSKTVKLSKKHIKAICFKSEFFRGFDDGKLYYVSSKKLITKHWIWINKTIRGDKMSKNFINQFRSLAGFKAFILKCFVERDLNKKFKNKITFGRISYQQVANYFGISKRNSIYLLQRSTAKPLKNIYEFPKYKFLTVNEFGNWMLNNWDKKINGFVVGKNPKSYRLKKLPFCYVLIQELPNIYKFTGVFLRKVRRGKLCQGGIKPQ